MHPRELERLPTHLGRLERATYPPWVYREVYHPGIYASPRGINGTEGINTLRYTLSRRYTP